MKSLVFFVFVMFLCNGVFAISGVSPPIYNLNFKSNLSRELVFNFVSDEGVVSELSVIGDLSEYVVLDKARIVGRESVVATLNLPEYISNPGINIIRIAARQSSGKGSGIGAVTEVRGLIRINVPYPGKYVELDLNVPNANVGEDVNLTLDVSSLGKESVSADILIQVFKNNSLVDNFDFGNQFIKSGESVNFSIILNTEDYVAGYYTVTALAYFGENNSSRDDVNFRLGEFRVDILNYTKNFKEGKIGKFNIEVESFWNNLIEDFYAEVFIVGKDDVGFLTTKTNLKPWEKRSVCGFLDVSDLNDGIAKANIVLHYGNKTTSKIVDLRIVEYKDFTFYFLLLLFTFLFVLIFINRVGYFFKKKVR